jgi:hypothetical protein
MPGNETQNYDMVIEFAEQAYRDILGAVFDSDGFLCTVLDNTLNSIPGVDIPCGAFTVDVLFDRPTDISLPASARDPIDIRMGLGESGSLGTARIVVGVDVDRTSENFDIIRINFADLLYHVDVDIGGIGDPLNLLENFLRDTVEQIPILPVPVDRTTTDPTGIRVADAKIIDDTSASDLDASATLLTFGGGTPGNRDGLTRSFIPSGGTGGIAMFFGWLCRIISPALEDALALPDGSFTNCRLNRTVRIDEDEDVDLTRLELTLDDGFIRVSAAVRKSGFCYTATGTVAARIRIEIVDGNLVVESEVEDPDIDLDIPWYCYLAGAVIGALLGGILFGVIGAIVGAVLVPLIMWITTEIIEGLLESITDRVVDAINSISPDVNVPAVGINILFDRVFIDGIVIKCLIEAVDNAPIRSEGTLHVRNGEFVDLDKGEVGGENLPGADLSWQGDGFGRRLRTVCTTAMGRTGSKSFQKMTRFKLYGFNYESPESIPLHELADENWWGGFFGFGDRYDERRYVYGVRTNEDRYAAIQVFKVEDHYIRIRYKTYEKFLPSLEIKGGFKCERRFFVPKDAVVTFEPTVPEQPPACAVSSAITADLKTGREPLLNERIQAEKRKLFHTLATRSVLEIRAEQPVEAARLAGDRPALSALAVRPVDTATVELANPWLKRVGRWVGEYESHLVNRGRFDAITNGFQPPLTFEWSIDKEKLTADTGSLVVKGVRMRYTVNGGRLVLDVTQGKTVEFELGVTVRDNRETVMTTSRCIKYVPKCKQTGRYIPDWNTYMAVHMTHFGVVEVK